ncbi:MAG: hypothetical protein QXE64_00575 [Candidatus Pacearchaeota archaeon]
MIKKKAQRKRQEKNALASVLVLWREALKAAMTNKERARNYIKQIRAIKKHVKIKLPPEIRRGYCKKCYIPLIKGRTAEIKKIKTKKGILIELKCIECGAIRRYIC